MLAFIIPVKHPARCSSYARVVDLLEETLESICRQTVDDFRVIVVMNRVPSYRQRFKNTYFVEVQFPPPPKPRSVDQEYTHIYLDKGCKQAIGLIEARWFDPAHIMFADADDLVSRRLAEFVAARPSAPGWFMQKGFVYSNLTKLIEERDDFWSYCGTSHILRSDVFKIPDSLSSKSTQDELITAFGYDHLTLVLGDHNKYRMYSESEGAPLAPLPFIGAIWRADTGENSSRAVWNQRRFGPIWGRCVSPEITEEFGLVRQERSTREFWVMNLWRARYIAARMTRSILRSAS
jgi:hypothetical protein